jgi:hypothetical protein
VAQTCEGGSSRQTAPLAEITIVHQLSDPRDNPPLPPRQEFAGAPQLRPYQVEIVARIGAEIAFYELLHLRLKSGVERAAGGRSEQPQQPQQPVLALDAKQPARVQRHGKLAEQPNLGHPIYDEPIDDIGGSD